MDNALRPHKQRTKELRPVGTIWQETMSGNKFDPLAKGRILTYEVIGHKTDEEGNAVSEIVKLIKVEKPKPENFII